MARVLFLLVAGIALAFIGCSSDGGGGGSSSSVGGSGTFTDKRDGQTYKWVKIGEQVWMAENLNFNANGSKCGSVLTGDGFLVDDNTKACGTYGRLYDWATAMGFKSSCNSSNCFSGIGAKHRGVCPEGWHLPSDAEWLALTDFVGGSSTAGTKLKSKDGWNIDSDYIPSTDNYGFAALPGGYGGLSIYTGYGVYFGGAGSSGNWWSATESSNGHAWYRRMSYRGAGVLRDFSDKYSLFSVRCIKD